MICKGRSRLRPWQRKAAAPWQGATAAENVFGMQNISDFDSQHNGAWTFLPALLIPETGTPAGNSRPLACVTMFRNLRRNAPADGEFLPVCLTGRCRA